MERIELWTDGSAGPTNPGPGGWAVTTETEPLLYGHAVWTTNNYMEGYAILAALQWAAGRPVRIHTDSQHWKNSITEWTPKWARNGWRKSNGEPVANLPLVQTLNTWWTNAAGGSEIVWVRGHNGNPGNMLADVWAGRARTERLICGRNN